MCRSRVPLHFFLLILISLAAPQSMPAERPALKVGLALSGGGARTSPDIRQRHPVLEMGIADPALLSSYS